MSKRGTRRRDNQANTATPPPPSSRGVLQVEAPRLPMPAAQQPGGGPWRVVAALVLGIGVPLAVVLAVVLAERDETTRLGLVEEGGRPSRTKKRSTKAQPVRPPTWEVVSAQDRVIDTFMRLRNTDSPEVAGLYGRAKVDLTDRVLPDAEEPMLVAEHFLHSDTYHIIDIWRGVWEGEYPAGELVPHPGRYTLITRGTSSTPLFRLASIPPDKGRIQRHANNADLIVDVINGKVFAVRWDCHNGP